jgi:hypothetical protein
MKLADFFEDYAKKLGEICGFGEKCKKTWRKNAGLVKNAKKLGEICGFGDYAKNAGLVKMQIWRKIIFLYLGFVKIFLPLNCMVKIHGLMLTPLTSSSRHSRRA